MFNICFVPLVTLRGVSLSHVLHLSQTWAVSSGVEKRPPWFKLRRWLPTPSVLSQVRSTQCVPLKICILEEHAFVPFTSENTDQSRTGGLNLLQTGRMCGTGMTSILLLLTNAQSVFSSSLWRTPCTASRYNRFHLQFIYKVPVFIPWVVFLLFQCFHFPMLCNNFSNNFVISEGKKMFISSLQQKNKPKVSSATVRTNNLQIVFLHLSQFYLLLNC